MHEDFLQIGSSNLIEVSSDFSNDPLSVPVALNLVFENNVYWYKIYRHNVSALSIASTVSFPFYKCLRGPLTLAYGILGSTY